MLRSRLVRLMAVGALGLTVVLLGVIAPASEAAGDAKRVVVIGIDGMDWGLTESMMAAGGCGMLLWVILWLLVAGLVEGLQLPLREMTVWRVWPVLLFAPLLVFLALQLLQFVFPTDDDPQS